LSSNHGGYKVFTAQDGQEALDKLGEVKPDLLILAVEANCDRVPIYYPEHLGTVAV
jgi:chemotaxis response regulator CheB